MSKWSPAEEANRQGVAHCRLGRMADGIEAFRKAVRLAPEVFEYQLNLGRALNAQRQWDEAETVLRTAHELSPEQLDVHLAIAATYAGRGQADRLTTRYRKAMAERPDDAILRRNCCAVLLEIGHLAEALELAQTLAAALPNDTDAALVTANCLAAAGQFERCEQALLAVLAQAPRHAEAGFLLGTVRAKRGDYEGAAAAFENVLRISPDHIDAMQQLAHMSLNMGQVTRALTLLQRAIALRSNNIECYRLLAAALAYRGSIPEAVAAYRTALSIAPNDKDSASALAYTLSLDTSAGREAIYEAHTDWGRKHAAHGRARHTNQRGPDRKLKIGYVSPDFREHSVSYFVEPVLEHHDRAAFDVYCYADGRQFDATSERLKKAADHWRPLQGCSDEDALRQIQADQIDILVDLAGHTASHRLTLFGQAPAPVQVTWLGYPETTGVPQIGYKITDAIIAPDGAERFATETLLRLDDGCHCYRPPRGCPVVAPAPFLSNGYVTFGSFSDLPKVNPGVVGAWSAVLCAVPASRLLFKCRQFADEAVRDKYTAMFEAAGVERSRIMFLGRSPTSAEHLAQYGAMDICLDTFPYSGTTTICEALWMGVPVVTMMGERAASRVGGSVLRQAGLPQLVARDSHEFIDIAVALAHDPAQQTALREGMRPRLNASSLRGEAGFTRKLEAAYRDAWRRWCSAA